MEVIVFMRVEVIQTLQLKQANKYCFEEGKHIRFFSRQEMNHFHTLQILYINHRSELGN